MPDHENALAVIARPPTAICTVCRVLVERDCACEESTRHPIARLDSESGQQALADEIWRTPRFALFLTPESRALLAITLIAVVLLVAFTAGPLATTILGMVTVLFGVPAILGIRTRMTTTAGKKLPRGNPARVLLPPGHGRKQPLHGWIRTGVTCTAPFTGRRCAGYAIALRCDEYIGGETMLMHAAVVEMEVELDDGRTLVIPAGRVRLEFPSLDRVLDHTPVHAFLARIDPDLGHPAATIPFDHAWEGILLPGHQVAVMGEVVEAPLSYRESGQKRLLRGIPHVRVLDN